MDSMRRCLIGSLAIAGMVMAARGGAVHASSGLGDLGARGQGALGAMASASCPSQTVTGQGHHMDGSLDPTVTVQFTVAYCAAPADSVGQPVGAALHLGASRAMYKANIRRIALSQFHLAMGLCPLRAPSISPDDTYYSAGSVRQTCYVGQAMYVPHGYNGPLGNIGSGYDRFYYYQVQAGVNGYTDIHFNGQPGHITAGGSPSIEYTGVDAWYSIANDMFVTQVICQ